MEVLREFHSQNREELALYEMFFTGQLKGTFVEMGALDGRSFSNTLAFEQALQWTGVLIEPNPAMCDALRHNRPNATVFCHAVSRTNASSMVSFQAGAHSATFSERDAPTGITPRDNRRHVKSIAVHARPLWQMLHASGLSRIDLFSLDVEGAELRVLASMDFALVHVRVWCIEVPTAETADARAKRDALAALMRGHGYRRHEWRADLDMPFNQLWVWDAPWPG